MIDLARMCPYCREEILTTDMVVKMDAWQEEESYGSKPEREGPVHYHAGCIMEIVNNKLTYLRSDILAGDVARPREGLT